VSAVGGVLNALKNAFSGPVADTRKRKENLKFISRFPLRTSFFSKAQNDCFCFQMDKLEKRIFPRWPSKSKTMERVFQRSVSVTILILNVRFFTAVETWFLQERISTKI
jgi:hypothetical protein